MGWEVIRAALIADSHFREDSRFEECIHLHNVALDQMAEERVHVIFHAGDVYDRRSTPRERAAAADWLSRASAIAPVVVVRGNHDQLGDLSLFDPHVMSQEYDVWIAEQPRTQVVRCARYEGEEQQFVEVHLLPWPRKAELLSFMGREASPDDASAAAAECLRDLFLGFAAHRRFEDVDEPRWPSILLAHAMVRGSVTSTGQPLVGCDMEVSLNDLALARADVVALGHIHKGQTWSTTTDDGISVPIVYPGSPRRTAFGELEPKGWTLLTLNPARKVDMATDAHGDIIDRGHDLWTCETRFVELPAASMVLLEVRWSGPQCFTDELDKLGPLIAEGLRLETQCEVRLRYTVPSEERSVARAAALEWENAAISEGALVKVEEIVESAQRARAPEVAAARSTRDKLTAWWASRDDEYAKAHGAAMLVKLAEIES